MKCRPLASLFAAKEGSVAVEFALIAPVLLGLMFGVLQIGVAMQNYNALRSVAADVARYAVVNYQTDNKLANSQIQSYGRSLAIRSPYALASDRLAITVTTVGTPRIAGTIEKTVTLTYSVPSFLGVLGLGEFPITHSQAIFLPT